ncbi:lytic transglycosylase domain-containing protein [Streptomyces luteolus]|uniref:Lytic transglycosylase domain-containing protein n=1 Tax=Streptomyces luteolus TaxID=3043615 RepID=A0ABT6T629_9ACTN|nr:lytic transglycosylase domain-containing protein [Streptomyces sp. B-S-A12]MDI3423337.1 lytic transglycosylase domain-containing protein [Streptomyces sp. B-S-A12]
MAALHGRRLRKTAVSAALAAAAVAALSASQAPGITDTPQGRRTTESTAPADDSATGNSPYYTDLPRLESPIPPGDGDEQERTGEADAGIPATVLDAYKKAEAELRASKPGCRLPWQLLAAIGKVESGQASGGRVDSNGTTLEAILGPPLNGVGFANIRDTDGGSYDGDTTYDRAVGPMQFIPSTWATWAQDGNGDGRKDPNNIYDAALAAGRYLCAGDRDLSTTSGLHQAILSYNRSQHYLRTVLSWLEYYRKGTHEIPDGTGVLPVGRSNDDAKSGSGKGGSGDGGKGHTGTGRADDKNPGENPGKNPGKNPGETPDPGSSTGGSGGETPGGDPSEPGTDPTEPGGSHPGGGGPGGSGGGGGGGESPNPTPTPTPTPAPEDRVAKLADAGTGELTATAGQTFAVKPAVRAHGANGAGVAEVKVRFEIVGDTDSRFAGGAASATVTTDSRGKAVAPELRAGEKTGEFKVRAKVVGRTLDAVDHTAEVTARQADELTRVGDKELTCEAGAEYADPVEVKATYKGAAAAGVEATATMIKSADDPTANDKGPYFKDADGKALRTLKDLKTDTDGTLKLPKIYAGDAKGTYLLRIETVGGGSVTVELKVS